MSVRSSVRRAVGVVALSALLAGCGGDGGGGGSGGGGATGSTPTPTPTGTPTPTASAGCSLRDRQDWVSAQMREWYLFYDTLPTSLDPSSYTTVDSFLDALTATARSQRKDRYFTYLTSIAQENAYYSKGSSAGFGWRLGLDSSGRLYVTEAYEGAPALNANIDRGAEILAIGTSSNNLQSVSGLYNAGGSALSDALGPSTSGTQRTFQIRDASGTRTVAVTKTDFSLSPVSSRYGVKIITDNGQRYGYVNLRTFITTANDQLRSAFAQFKAAGITNVVVDLRYNGGGLVETAVLMTNLLGGNRSTSDVMSYMSFRPEKAAENNETYLFTPQPESIAATKIAFIGTGSTASASEFVINAFVPYLGANDGLIGGNTYGKPVGQIPRDQPSCDDRLRVIAFALQNSARQGAYYNGLASTMQATCQAGDDIGYPMGDAREASTRAALDFLQGKSCTRISATATATASGPGDGLNASLAAWGLTAPTREALMPPFERRTPAQREVPGLY